MSLTLVVFLAAYATLAVLCLLRHPIYGVIGYYITYIMSPATRWWGESLTAHGFRFNYIIALVAIIGFIIRYGGLKSRKGFSRQEVLLWLFVGSIFLAGWINPSTEDAGFYSIKIAKTAVMLFVLRRSVDNLSRFRLFVWALVLATAYNSFDTRFTASFKGGRIESGAGGSDFIETNFLAAHLSMMLPLLGALFLTGRWRARALLAVAAGFITDIIIQCRSRGAFVSILFGSFVAIIFAPRGSRKKIYVLSVVGAVCALSLVDVNFWDRMGNLFPMAAATENLDLSASQRILAWHAAIEMAKEHPLGVGYGNFKNLAGSYNPAIENRDTHDTYLNCLAELGVQGLMLLVFMIVNAVFQAYRLRKISGQSPNAANYGIFGYALGVGLVIYLIAGIFITSTYIEEFYLILLLPDILLSCYRTETAMNPVASTGPSLEENAVQQPGLKPIARSAR